MNESSKETFTIKLNGRDIEVQNGQTVLEVATQQNIDIPTLCYHESLEAHGGCRLCIVEAKMGKRTKMITSCNYEVWEGLEILTDSPRVKRNRRMTAELLLARCPEVEMLKSLAAGYGVDTPRFTNPPAVPVTEDHESEEAETSAIAETVEGFAASNGANNEAANDCILCGLCVRICRDRMKASVTDFVGRGVDMVVDTPYHRGSEVCLSCGACEHVCPTGSIRLSTVYPTTPSKQQSEFDLGLKARPTIYIPFSQALPNVPVIDRENCVHFNTGGCEICEEVCPADAIDYGQTDKATDIETGAVILAPGFCLYDPSQKPALGYDTYPDVVSSLQFERILSASGPCNGKVIRPSDGKTPDSIAFIQCVGSRDSEHNYCSSVCCMYAVKEAVMAKEHEPDLECEIFYMDIRAHGKGFDEYVERAKSLGIRFTRCRPSQVEELKSTGRLSIGYVNEDTQEYGEKSFGMVVLSAGFEPPSEIQTLAKTFGIELSDAGFASSQPFRPVATSNKGVYVCGPFAQPKDIPETVVEASSAAANAMVDLASVRGTEVTEQSLPPERPVDGEPPRIGVFVCHCGLNIGGVVDVPSVAEYAARLPNVVYATDSMYTCSSDTQDDLKDVIEEHRLNRVIVASCSPRTHEPLFQQTIREAGLNPNLFEMANIRDQCSWVHMQDHASATDKSRDLVRMAVAKANILEPLGSITLAVTQTAFVLGGGIAGMTAALSIADQGFDVYLVEKTAELGGNARDVERSLDGRDVQSYLRGIIDRVKTHDRISLYTSTEIEHVEGFVGNFKTKIRVGHPGNGTKPEVVELEHGVVVIATGARESTPTEYLYGEDDHVTTLQQLDRSLSDPSYKVPDSVVFIQCVGSREDDHQYCSRICCAAAIKQAVRMKKARPESRICILYRDIRTYGFREAYYSEARELGIVFVKYDVDRKPVVQSSDNGVIVEAYDPVLQAQLEIPTDMLVLSSRIDANEENDSTAKLYKVPLTNSGFFLEAHVKLKPVEFATEGVFVCGIAHYPKDIDETIGQAMAASSRALTVLSKDTVEAGGKTAMIDPARCNACGACVSVCPYNAISIDEEKEMAVVNEVLCKGCGACVSTCKGSAPNLKGFKDEQILSMINAV